MNEKMDFENVYAVFDTMRDAFHPDGIGDEGINPVFHSLWTLFLNAGGWDEDEFFDELDTRSDEDYVCESCRQEEQEEQEKKDKEKAN